MYPRPRLITHASALALACGLAAAATPPALAASSGGASLAAASNSARVSDSGHVYSGDSRHLGDRILRSGMRGDDVRTLQGDLTTAGYSTPTTGYFGSVTKSNVVRFQRAEHLSADGVVTWSAARALLAMADKTRTAAPQEVAAPTGHATIIDGMAVAPSDAPPAVKAVIAAGNKIAFKPYIYGGGHGSWSDSGYDCSGSVSYALHGGRLISSPEDSSDLESYGSRGGGRWITLWSNSGHAYMYVAGLRFDTSAQSGNGGDRWTTQRRSNGGFVERHPTGL